MKATGIVRKVDELGRVVIPVELRHTLNISVRDSLEIYTDQDHIILKKYEPADICTFCGSSKDIIPYGGRFVCSECVERLQKKVQDKANK